MSLQTQLFFIIVYIVNYSMAASISRYDEPRIEQYENYYNEINLEDENNDTNATRNALLSPLQHWPTKVLFYRISEDYTHEEAKAVREALEVFNERTCLTFREYDNDPSVRYIYYKKSADMCGTKVGYTALTLIKAHDVLLNPHCLSQRGVIQHETLHVLGLFHEQSRPDRNEYVQIEYSNIPQQYWSQFVSYPKMYVGTYNVAYDYNSLMHYSEYAFAADPAKPTIRAREGDNVVLRKMGQVNGPSEGDLQKINYMYKCDLR